MERVGAQGVEFVVSIVLARILAPEVYGSIALVSVFTTILNVFINNGIGNALIQKKDADNIDFSTIFYFNIVFSISLYLVMFVTAPLIAGFYEDASLTPVLRVLSLTVVIAGLKNVQQAYVSRTMQFKKFFFSTLGGTIGAAILGITIAVLGGGVWALVAQQVFNAAVDTMILWITVKWRPDKVFSFERFKTLFSYGWKLLVTALIENIYYDLRQLIIGKLYSSKDLAFYNKGKQFPYFITKIVNQAVDSVLFPVMSKEQDDIVHLRLMTKTSIKMTCYIMAPLMMGLAFAGNTIISVILTEKWLFCVPYLAIFCVAHLLSPIQTANINAIKAIGNSGTVLKLEIIKKIIGVGLLIVSMWFGVMAMAYSMLATSLISQIINALPNKKLLNYGYIDQVKDIMPSILLAVFMGVCVKLIEFLPFGLPLIVTLMLQIIVGATIYILLSKLFKLESFEYLKGIAKSFLSKKKKVKSKENEN